MNASKFSNFSIDYILGESTQTPTAETASSSQAVRTECGELNLMPGPVLSGHQSAGSIIRLQGVYEPPPPPYCMCCAHITYLQNNYSMTYCPESWLQSHPDCDKEESHCYQSTHQRQRNRIRTVFTENQMKQLDQLFALTEYPSAETRAELAKNTGLSEETVRVWFKNRRARRKRQRTTNGAPAPTNDVHKAELM